MPQPEITEPLLKNEWSELQTTTIIGESQTKQFCYQERLVETHYGPELEVVFWEVGAKETTTQHSQEAAGAYTQICWTLEENEDDEDDYDVEYPDNCGLEL